VEEDLGEDEPTEVELAEEARIDGLLAAASDAVRAVIEEYHEAFGYGIPTVILGQVGRWYSETAGSPDLDVARDAQRAAQVLSDLYEGGDDSTQTIIATGFLEALPYAHEQRREVVDLLPGAAARGSTADGDLTPG
jgi:hypothetical protein